jgi:hypothetical protein
MSCEYIKLQYKTLDNYTYIETDDNEYYYYYKPLQLFFNKQKKILCNSNIYAFETNKKYLNDISNSINSLNLDNNENFQEIENIIAIQRWFVTYGHFKDEIFNLCNFYELFNNKKYKVLMNYADVKHMNYSMDNYDKLKDILFNDQNFINAANFNCDVIKIKKLILITHTIIDSPMFHMFPQNVTNKIFSKINNVDIDFNKNVFITRGQALHLPRNLTNQSEIEEYFKNINYNVINPEITELELFINSIKNAENIYVTWGGAMVNLCYVNKNSNIFLLQSQSYRNEDIFITFKFLKNYNNLYMIRCDNDNKINMHNCIKTKISPP